MTNEEDIRRTNPKHPTLVGYAMAANWDYVRIDESLIEKQEEKIASFARRFREHRRRWGQNPPKTEAEWSEFWYELHDVYDMAYEVRESLAGVRKGLREVSRKGLDIVSKNGIDVNGTDPFTEIEQLVAAAREMMEEQGDE